MVTPTTKRFPWRPALLGLFLTAVAVLPLLTSPFYVRLLSLVGIFGLVVMGLVLLTGYTGLASLGQAAFVGVGAYTAAILASRFGVNPWLGMVAGVLLSGFIAWLIGLVTLRLKGHFLALATLAWGLIITGVLKNWMSVTGGNTGYGSATGNRFPPLSLFGYELRDERAYYYLIWACTLLVLLAALNLMRSRTGRAIRSLRSGSVAAASFGVNVQRIKMVSFVLAAMFAGLAGGLFAFRELYLNPNIAGLGASIDYLIMAVLGGLQSLWGALFGAGLFVFLREALQDYLPRLVGRSGNYDVEEGEILGLIGPNGAGKTTMFNLITGVLSPSSGEILYAGRNISRLPPHRIAELGVARTFQHLNLSADQTLIENVALGAHTLTRSGLVRGMLALERREDARVRAAAYRQLERVGLADLAFEEAGNLPLGKQRLLEVARALLADPTLLLLDEPAAGLRQQEKEELMTLIRRLREEGITVLLVEHDMDVVMELVDRIVVMNYGTKLAQGTPAAVRRDPAVLEAYLGVEDAA